MNIYLSPILNVSHSIPAEVSVVDNRVVGFVVDGVNDEGSVVVLNLTGVKLINVVGRSFVIVQTKKCLIFKYFIAL